MSSSRRRMRKQLSLSLERFDGKHASWVRRAVVIVGGVRWTIRRDCQRLAHATIPQARFAQATTPFEGREMVGPSLVLQWRTGGFA